MPTIAILSSNARRHNFLVNSFAKRFTVVGLVREAKENAQKRSEIETEKTIMDEHLCDRDAAEETYFADHADVVISPDDTYTMPREGANSREVFEWIKTRNPEYIVLFGTSIIKNPLLSFYEKRILNMHLGLSPYYRGSGTNFWPLVDTLPECVGTTIHLATPAVDAGAILTQIRPASAVNDTCHSLGCKTIIAGTENYIDALLAYHEGTCIPMVQDLSFGKVFRRRDFCDDAVKKMRKNFADGMMKTYTENKNERDAKYPIISM
ncbi:MAG: formyl transferase [Parcubacteria group bacterium Gr01-1014_48]|nr:MAG: formyl transferase [Parcubacteria group bacterium Greene0416_14]TSC74448.1 MAG: formyl transferase [Parcubacteria group bacterium Gr01-1014_48]TSD01758.1 MAG: formyl transferase [Parcubacteria group bacterium Greene1014_15]TSD08472.1 MAG: formyl transferase [Parcubacteria group bacterium Greene0714_4]